MTGGTNDEQEWQNFNKHQFSVKCFFWQWERFKTSCSIFTFMYIKAIHGKSLSFYTSEKLKLWGTKAFIIIIIIIIIIITIIIIFCFFYLVFDIYIMWFLRSNKRWLSERFSLLSRYELLLLEHFLFCFNVFIFLYDYQFLFSFSSLLLWLFLLLFLQLSLPLLFFYFQCFYHSILSLYISNIFKFWTNDVAEHFSKLAVKILRLYQCLSWELWTLFA